MFNLPLYRHRYFESNLGFLTPPHPTHRGGTNASRGFSSFKLGAEVICVAGHNFSVADARLAMDIDWMGQKELSQAIPPSYSEYLGKQITNYLERIKLAA
jgi:DNA (cytosine-5)-methyltransferase 1